MQSHTFWIFFLKSHTFHIFPDVSSVYQQEKSGKLISALEIRENSGKFIKSSGTRGNFTILIFLNYVLFIIVSVRNFSDK